MQCRKTIITRLNGIIRNALLFYLKPINPLLPHDRSVMNAALPKTLFCSWAVEPSEVLTPAPAKKLACAARDFRSLRWLSNVTTGRFGMAAQPVSV